MPNVYLSSGEIELVIKLVQNEKDKAKGSIRHAEIPYAPIFNYISLLDSVLERLEKRLIR